MKNSIKHNDSIIANDFLFYLALGIYTILTMFESSFFCQYYPESLVKIGMIFTVFLVVLKEILVNKITLKEIIYLLICAILAILIFYRMNNVKILPLFFLIYSSRNIELERILKFIEYLSLAILLTIIISSKLGIVLNYISYSSGRMREYLGFRYALFPQMYIFNISAISLYRHKNKISLKSILFFTILNYIIYKHTLSRLSFLLYLILLSGYLLLNNKNIFSFISKKKLIKKILVYSFFISAISAFYITLKYDASNQTMNNINTISEGRVYLGKNAINNYGIRLFGNKVSFHGNGLGRSGIKNENQYDYVDCLYINVAIRYGACFLLLYLIIHTIALSNINKKNDIFLLYILFVIALHGIVDDLGMELYYNSFWFAIGNNIVVKKQNMLRRKEYEKN